ncbi:MAG: hypothetical protein AAGC92_16920 [Pseudomonadota bacterium]
MLQDKKNDLDAQKRKKLLRRLIAELSRDNPDFYYQSTPEIARHIQRVIADGTALNGEERALTDRLSLRDIEVLLSLH